MSDGQQVHPDAARLRAFGLGQLDPAESSAIENHVNSCSACCQTLWSLPDDQLVSLLRQAFHKPPDVAPASEATTVLPSVAPSAPEMPAELARHPRYRLVEVLGVGGMGVVYKAEHRLMERPVALKVIDRSLTDKPAVVERFRREVKAAGQLSHPNIVHAYDADQAGDSHFLVMEFVEGTTLARLVEQQGPLPVAQACDYVRQAALGLERAHEHGMVHRDIKPHNLMRTPQGQVKILDFGLARLVSEAAPALSPSGEEMSSDARASRHLTQMGMVMGTADYMAPEQATDAHAADIRADIYSLGCTLYYLLTGRTPFPEGTVLDKLLAHGRATPKPLSDFRADVPAALTRVVERMMGKDPARRYQTPAEVATALQPFVAAAPSPKRRRLRYAVAALLLAGALTAAAAVIIVQTDKGEFVIDTSDDNIAVQLDKAGGVKIYDRAASREYRLKVGEHRIRSGEYEVIVSELPGGIEMTGSDFKLKRGETVRLTARARFLPGILKTFDPEENKPLTRDGVSRDQGGWRIDATEPRTVRLFEVVNADRTLEDCQVLYQARLKTENLKGKAYLEMWCHFPGEGEAFSKDLLNPLSGTTDWVSCQTPFFLRKGERPDRIKLNLVVEGTGRIWIKEIELRKEPLPPMMKGNR
jgi:hypothetical protein